MSPKRYSKSENVRAGALLCTNCYVELQEATVDVEWEGKTVRNTKVLRCPICLEEMFTPQQLQEAIKKGETGA